MVASPGKRRTLPTRSRPKSADTEGAASIAEATPEPILRRRHVYGRTKGKTLKPRQSKLMETLLPQISVPLDQEHIDLKQLFGKRDEFWLEVGFGGGEHLVWQAERLPQVGIIGCEPFQNGVAQLVSKVAETGLPNIRIHPDDARLVLERLGPGSLSRIFVLYPDPWPKLRHNKRRFVNEDTLALMAIALKPGGQFRFASDIPAYVDWVLKMVERHNRKSAIRFEETLHGRADRAEKPADWPGTRYEEKALAAGRAPAYLDFIRD